MCSRFGEIIECRICYNSLTRKHLGLAKVVFESERSARECCLAYNQKTKMGNIMTVFLDTMGRERAKMIDSLCNPNSLNRSFSSTNLSSINTYFNFASATSKQVNNASLSPNLLIKPNSSQSLATSSAVGSSSSPSSSTTNVILNSNSKEWVSLIFFFCLIF